MKKRHIKKHSGLTLFEVIIGLVIVGILGMVFIPNSKSVRVADSDYKKIEPTQKFSSTFEKYQRYAHGN